jgi:hypothetical protein
VYAAATLLAQFLFGITSRAPAPYGTSIVTIFVVILFAAAAPILRLRHLALSALLKAE